MYHRVQGSNENPNLSEGKKARTRFTNIVYCFTEKYQENMSDSVYDQSAMLKKKILHDLG